MSRRGRTDDTRGRGLDLWQAPANAGEPLSCLATTYTFDATFFETECLGRFLQMETHPQESETVSYLIEREEKLAAARVCVLVDRHHATEKESLRWDVVPVIVPRAVQHAKVALLCWARHVRLIVASANLTEPGYRKNVETFAALDASLVALGPLDAIEQSIAFLERVVERAVGRDTSPSPKARTREILSAARRHIAAWPRDQSRRQRVVPVFGGIGESVIEQCRRLWPAAGPPRDIAILSPFFDPEDADVAAWKAASSLLAKRGDRSAEFFVPAERLADGRTRVFAPRQLIDAAANACDVDVWTIPPEQDGETRPLHAKGLYLTNDDWKLFLFGSSNFTRAGLALNPAASNLEANLAYVAREGDPETKHLDRIWPTWSTDAVDLEDPTIVWDPANSDTDEGETGPALPGAFEEALYHPGPPARLVLRLATGLPQYWTIRTVEGAELLASDGSPPGGGEHTIDWADRPVPFLLSVTWRPADDVWTAAWPVNVSEPASLPPPDCLRNLSLEELIDVLGSTRPLHVAVAQMLRRRGKNHAFAGLALDPHKRVNTETFLLRRTKRVATALARMRERLERPAFSADAFLWRLRGPLGALALANAFNAEARTPAEARFFLVELALTLHRTDVGKTAAGGLAACVARAAVHETIDAIEQIAATATAGKAPIDHYVQAAFTLARN